MGSRQRSIRTWDQQEQLSDEPAVHAVPAFHSSASVTMQSSRCQVQVQATCSHQVDHAVAAGWAEAQT